jgi:hypothetical protein
VKVSLNRRLVGPMRRGTLAGHALVLVGSRVVARLPLRLGRALPPPPPASTGLIVDVGLLALLSVAVLVGCYLGLRRALRLRLTRRDRLEAG